MSELDNLVSQMDDAMNSIESLFVSLQDLETTLTQLRENMDVAVYRGEERFLFMQHHRMIRVLSTSMKYITSDLRKDIDKAFDISTAIFKEVKGIDQVPDQVG